MHQILRLDGQHSCALIEFAPGRAPVWRHYGARLGHTPALQTWSLSDLRRLPPGSMDHFDGIPLLPCFGNGSLHAPALVAHSDGLHGIQDLVASHFEQSNHSEGTVEVQTLVLHLHESSTEQAAGLEATITLRMHGDSDVLSVQTTLANSGTHTLQVDHLAAGTVPIAAHLQELAHFGGQWAHEYQWTRGPVDGAGWQRTNRTGKTSHDAPPSCFVLGSATTDHQGEVIAAHLGWSGNHRLALDRNEDGSLLLQAGEWLAPGEVRLEPGETVHTPQLFCTWSDSGINRATQNLHRFTRSHILRWPHNTMPARPVHLNTWEAVYFDHDDAVLRALATQAAALGVERFVLDDGWFPGRPDDRSGLGDWWPDPAKYPNGLGPLIAHVHSTGMSFGLWVEPEMVNPDSDLYRTHPDWALQTQGRPLRLGRHQLVLDITRPEVSNYLFDKLDALLSDNAISYLKWDMNRDLAQAEDAHGRMAYRRQVPALYALLERVHAAHPTVEIESCASGGGRMDLGILRHTQRFWTSDNNDALSRVAIQSGAARIFPLEVLGAHVGPAPAHSTGRSQGMDFRCAVALFGHMGVEADVRKLTEADQATLARWIGIYKCWRDVLHSGTFSQGRTANGVWRLVQTAGRCVLGVFTVQAPASPQHAPLALPGFASHAENTDAAWRVRLLGIAGQERARGQAASPMRDALQDGGITYAVDELRHVGLALPNMNPESALVFSLERLAT
jgi:alpha-galactosidase